MHFLPLSREQFVVHHFDIFHALEKPLAARARHHLFSWSRVGKLGVLMGVNHGQSVYTWRSLNGPG